MLHLLRNGRCIGILSEKIDIHGQNSCQKHNIFKERHKQPFRLHVVRNFKFEHCLKLEQCINTMLGQIEDHFRFVSNPHSKIIFHFFHFCIKCPFAKRHANYPHGVGCGGGGGVIKQHLPYSTTMNIADRADIGSGRVLDSSFWSQTPGYDGR